MDEMDNRGETLLKKSKILQAVHRLAQNRKEKVYLVGGVVRDLLLLKPLGKDIDFVSANARELSQEVADATKGVVFPLDVLWGTWRVVIKTRKKKTELDFSALMGPDIVNDLKQRDFTVNSMAIELQDFFRAGSFTLLDPMHGFSDLRRKILRANAEESLRQDPLRMLRAFRLAFTLGLQIEDETLGWIQKNKDQILRSAEERIRSEFFAALAENQAECFLRHLFRSGLLERIFPEIRDWETLEQGAYHDFPLLEHAFRTVRAAEWILAHLQHFYPAQAISLENYFAQKVEEGISRKALFKFAAFCHDSGKPGTRGFDPDTQSIRFFDHDQQGEKINVLMGRRLKLSKKSIRFLSELTRRHMRILSLAASQEVSSRAQYRFFRDAGPEGIALSLLALADRIAAKNFDLHRFWGEDLPHDLGKVKKVVEKLLHYYYEVFSSKTQKPLLSGREIMEVFDLPQGKEVGNFLNRLREAEISGLVHTREEALEFLNNIDRSRPFG
jgi:poly(A) polymerase